MHLVMMTRWLDTIFVLPRHKFCCLIILCLFRPFFPFFKSNNVTQMFWKKNKILLLFFFVNARKLP
jgi:hypothetical protein